MARISASSRLADIAEQDPKLLSEAPPRPSVLTKRPTPVASTGRSRKWEKENPTPVSFRNFPHDLRDTLSDIAKAHGVRIGEVARLFVERALELYQAGELEISTALEDGRLTIYPGED